ncbi:MAG: nucleotidyltransferase family protein [Desulfobulbaceae bacterium]|nr:nucleotidyltransferase family protein [Desulfobulbaceae bacterium]
MSRIAAILLAAGKSSRMGQNKQLLPLDGKPFIRHCLDSLLEAGVVDIVVVLGANGAEIEPVIADLPVSLVWNSDPESDMAASVRIGLTALPDRTGGVLVCLGDHPLVSAATIKDVMAYYKTHPNKIIIPVCNGKRGHPTLFPLTIIEEIFAVATLRDIVHQDARRVALLDIFDPGVTADIDTPEDFQRIASSPLPT